MRVPAQVQGSSGQGGVALGHALWLSSPFMGWRADRSQRIALYNNKLFQTVTRYKESITNIHALTTKF